MKVYKAGINIKSKVMKGKENYLQEKGEQFNKICKTLREHDMSFL